MRRLFVQMLSLVTLTAAAAVCADVGNRPDPADAALAELQPLTALQGTWTLTATYQKGVTRDYPNRTVVFEGDEYRFYTKQKLVKKAVARVFPRKGVHALDLAHELGPNRGKVIQSIFRVDGDTLIMADGYVDRDARPKSFETTDANCFWVTTWNRKAR